jgi:hypothetical protein
VPADPCPTYFVACNLHVELPPRVLTDEEVVSHRDEPDRIDPAKRAPVFAFRDCLPECYEPC